MIAVLQSIHLLALAIWLGGTVFFSLVVGPTLFRSLPTEEAGRVMSALFPNYYRLGYVCGALLLVTGAVLWRTAADHAGRLGVAVVLTVCMLAAVLYAGRVLLPRAHALRQQLSDPAASSDVKTEFDRIHRRSVQLNGAVLLGNLVIVGIVASRLRY